MRKFFKMGLVILMVLMLVCSLVGCNNSGANSDDKQSTDVSSGLAEDVNNSNADSDNIGSEDDIGDDMRLRKHKVGDGYSYMLGETEVVVEVDIDDYLSEKGGKRSFDFDALAEHYGFTPKWLGYPSALLENGGSTFQVSLFSDSSKFTFNGIDDCFICCLDARYVGPQPEHKIIHEETAHTSSAIHNTEALYAISNAGDTLASSHMVVICAYTFEKAKLDPANFTFKDDFPDFGIRSSVFDFP